MRSTIWSTICLTSVAGASPTSPDRRLIGLRRLGPDAALRAIAAAGATVTGSVRYGDWSERWGRHAIAGCCDVCDGLREAGRFVRDEVAVVGIDNWEVMATPTRPPLATVDLPLEELGR